MGRAIIQTQCGQHDISASLPANEPHDAQDRDHRHHDGRHVPVQEPRLRDAQAFARPLHGLHDPAVDRLEAEPGLGSPPHGAQARPRP